MSALLGNAAVLLLFVIFAVYTFVGAVVLTAFDSRHSMMRWHDRQPNGVKMLFWMAWPYFVAAAYIKDCSR